MTYNSRFRQVDEIVKLDGRCVGAAAAAAGIQLLHVAVRHAVLKTHCRGRIRAVWVLPLKGRQLCVSVHPLRAACMLVQDTICGGTSVTGEVLHEAHI